MRSATRWLPRFVQQGFEPGDRLGIYLQNVPQFEIAMLATWKAGGIIVSISPMLKHKELSAQLADSGASALVTFESLWDEVARDVIADTDVRIAITTSELDFLDSTPPSLAAGDAIARSADARSGGADRRPPRRRAAACREPEFR